MRTATPASYWQPKTSTIMALSIQQPWADLIANGHKDIENRDWTTKYRGPLLIHAGKKWDENVGRGQFGTFLTVNDPTNAIDGLKTFALPEHIDLGGFVGIATLVDVVTESTSIWFRGTYGFVLRDARLLPFVSYKGSLGLFSVAMSSLRYMTPDGPGCVEDLEGSVPFTEQLARGKIAMRLDASVHPTGRLVEYYEVAQLSEVPHDRIR